MGLEVVLNEIIARGSHEEQQIVREAETERQRLLDAAEGEADEIRAKALQDTRGKVDALKREATSASEFEVRRRLLTAQREIAEDFRSRVLAALADLPTKEREKINAVLVKRALKDLPKGTVHARKDDLAALVKAGGWEKGNPIETVGGFQVESPDGSIVLDLRFETLLDGAWSDLQRVAAPLFQG